MRERVTKIGKGRLKKKFFQDVLFFKIADCGAMGNPGGVVWINTKGKSYCCNHCYGDVLLEELEDHFAPLKNSCFGILGVDSKAAEGWQYVRLGMGNHLLVANSVYEEFKEHTKGLRSCEIYGCWDEVAMKIIKKHKMGFLERLHMR